MTITSFRLEDELSEKLESITEAKDRSKTWIINEALRTYFSLEDEKTLRYHQTLEALDDVSAERLISGTEVMKWLETWGDSQDNK